MMKEEEILCLSDYTCLAMLGQTGQFLSSVVAAS